MLMSIMIYHGHMIERVRGRFIAHFECITKEFPALHHAQGWINRKIRNNHG